MRKTYISFDGKEFDTEEDCLAYERGRFPDICCFYNYDLEPKTTFGETYFLRIPDDWDKQKIEDLDYCWAKSTHYEIDDVLDIQDITEPGEWAFVADRGRPLNKIHNLLNS